MDANGAIHSGWAANGVAICTAANSQGSPQITADGSGGAIITWEDYRSSARIYAQRVDANGAIHSGWTANGVAICTVGMHPQITSDGAGGAIITWEMSSLGIHAQRVDANGAIHSGWTANGVAICTLPYFQEYPQITSDGAEGAIITWQDYRLSESHSDIYAQRVDANGVIHSGWTANGVAISTDLESSRVYPEITSDGAGGAYITWEDYRSRNTDEVYVERVTASGILWMTGVGEALCTGHATASAQITSDGAGGAIITWVDGRSGNNSDIYTQRVGPYGRWDPYGRIVHSEWRANGIGVCAAGYSQECPQVTSANAGGAIITWADGRSGNSDIYAQRADANGVVQWATNAVALCTEGHFQGNPQITTDGAGGAIITWQDYRSGSCSGIYAQRVDANGAIHSGWTANGVAICTAGVHPQITSDGAEGAIITWEDYRSGLNGSIYAQRVDANGVIHSGWTANGVPICTAGVHPQIASDGAGGVIITWEDYRSGGFLDIYAQRVDANGAIHSGWTANGVAICTAVYSQKYPQITSDGSGGAIIVWQDHRSGNYGNYDIYAQRVDSNGAIHNGWAANGVVICTALDDQRYPQITSDGVEGVIITWEDSRGGVPRIYAQRVDANGVIHSGWTANGVAICTLPYFQEYPQITSDGAGGAIITWEDYRSGSSPDIYAQRVDANGAIHSGWTANGVAICAAANYQDPPKITSDGSGGAIITWEDYRGGSAQIYAQRATEVGSGICAVTPLVIDLSEALLVGDSQDASFAITNEGIGTLTGSVSESSDQFRIISGGGTFFLSNGQSRVVTVRFEPTAPGTHSCMIETGTFLCSDVSITGTAIGPICTVVPGTIAFPGSTKVGTTRDTTFTIENEGGGILAGNVSESCDHFGIVSGGGPFSLSHGQSQVVMVWFQPTDHGGHSCAVNLGQDLCTNVSLAGNGWMCPPDSVLYVDAGATGFGDGSSWGDAFTELRDALAYFYICPNVKQIWVAEGTYKPTASADRTASFNLQNKMALYGGFAGNETNLSQRNLAEHTTILSGDIGVGGTATDNCYHVVKIDWNNSTWDAVLDGFTVTGGYANGYQTEQKRGGGIYIYAIGADPVIRNVTVWGNYAANDGGGMYCSSQAIVTNSAFGQNTASSGGGVYFTQSWVSLTNVRVVNNTAAFGGGIDISSSSRDKYINVLFYGNQATVYGGGLYYVSPSSTYAYSPQLTNVSFSKNSATTGGGAVYLHLYGKIVLMNSIMWGDSSGTGNYPEMKVTSTTTTSYSIVKGCGGSGAGWNPAFGTDGGHNLDANPLFFNAPGGDLRLQVGSPAIDSGNNSVPGGLPATDLAGKPRIQNGIVDMGAYEGGSIPVYVTVTTSPPGLNVAVDGGTFVAPRTFLSEAGLSHEIGVTTPQQWGDTLYSFAGWSDSGDTTHTVILPGTNVTYTASFARLCNYAQIDSIVDVPGDQGGWVRVYFKRSHYDNPHEAQYPIARYDIHRRVDIPVLFSTILAKGEIITGEHVATLPGGERVRLTAPSSNAGSRYLSYGDRYYLVNEAAVAAAPPGLWEVVGNVSAQQQAQYIRLSPTVADSSATIPWSVYYVSAHTTTPSIFYDSPPDSGYSVDNLAPGVPQGFEVAYNTGSGNHLIWDPCADKDFQYFKIYRGTSPDFVPAPGNKVHETAGTEWSDPDCDGWKVYYKVAAVDHAGNESGPASPETTTDAGAAEIPKAFALYQNVPNPFNPTTTVRYDVPSGGGRVTLRVYDVLGRIVQTLVDAVQSAGRKTVRWTGTNERGERVGTGIYFYRMEAPGFVQTKKMVLLR